MQVNQRLKPLCTLPDPAQLSDIPDGGELVLVEYLTIEAFAVLNVEGVAAWYDTAKPCLKEDYEISVNRRELQAAMRLYAADGLPLHVSTDGSTLHLDNGTRQTTIGSSAQPAAPTPERATDAASLFLEALKRGESAVDNGLLVAIATAPNEQVVFHFLPAALMVIRMKDGKRLNQRAYPAQTMSQLLEDVCLSK